MYFLLILIISFASILPFCCCRCSDAIATTAFVLLTVFNTSACSTSLILPLELVASPSD